MNQRKRYHALRAAGILLIFLFFCSSALGDIYKWVDAKGVVHFSDQPPALSDGTLEVESTPSAPPSTYQPPPKEKRISADVKPKKIERTQNKPKPSERPKVELYVTSWCKYCKLARKYLLANHIAFNEYDIEKDSQAAKRRRELDPRSGVPLAVINGHTIIGFSEKSYAWALEQ